MPSSSKLKLISNYKASKAQQEALANARSNFKDINDNTIKLLRKKAKDKYDISEIKCKDFSDCYMWVTHGYSLEATNGSLKKAKEHMTNSKDSELKKTVEDLLKATTERDSDGKLLRTDGVMELAGKGLEATNNALTKVKKVKPSEEYTLEKKEQDKMNLKEAREAFEAILKSLDSDEALRKRVTAKGTGLTTKVLSVANEALNEALKGLPLAIDSLKVARDELVIAIQSLKTLKNIHTTYDGQEGKQLIKARNFRNELSLDLRECEGGDKYVAELKSLKTVQEYIERSTKLYNKWNKL